MKIAIIGAMQEEVSLIKTSLEQIKSEKLQHLDIFQGELHEHQVILIQCGIGKVAASIATALVIQGYQPDLVINTGSAGGFDESLEVGDIVIADRLMHHDVDVTHFDYKLGQVPSMPESYLAASQFSKIAVDAASTLEGINTKSGLICSGDSFIGSDEKAKEIKHLFPDMKAVEMEAAAIGQACYMMDVPFVVIRSLSDIAGKESPISFEQYLKTAAKNSATLVMKIIEQISA